MEEMSGQWYRQAQPHDEGRDKLQREARCQGAKCDEMGAYLHIEFLLK